jgi:acetoin utilization deacetylase AcuC-like enzyme
MSLPDNPAVIGHLDPDTALSHHSFQAALRAAAAVCQAVDAVVTDGARHAFCAVRPPGHHAGPRGKVPSRKDPVGSHGFCLLNNIAIAAAYAMNVHR